MDYIVIVTIRNEDGTFDRREREFGNLESAEKWGNEMFAGPKREMSVAIYKFFKVL